MSDAARPVDPQELATQAVRLRSLARRLVADDATADDVVQDALVAAVTRPPREDVPLGPWLVGAVRNLAWKSRRATSRRERHEAGALPAQEAASPGDVAARSEAFRDLADAVHALKPVYRDVVVLHYFDDLAMPQVAQRLAIPVETARTRLKRALAMLRARLDAKYGRRAAWALLLVPPRAPAPLSSSSAATSAAAQTSIAASGALVVKKIAAAAVLVLLIVVGWQFFRPDEAGSAPGNTVADAAAATPGNRAATPRGQSGAASRDASAAATEGANAAPAATKWLLRGRLSGLDDESAAVAAAIELYVVPPGATEPPAPRKGESAVGRFEFDVTEAMTAAVLPEVFGVAVDHPLCLRTHVRVAPSSFSRPGADGAAVVECSVEVRRAAVVSLRVIDETGDAVTGAKLCAFAFDGKLPDESWLDFATSDVSGAARLRVALGSKHLVAAVSPGLAPSHEVVTGEPAATVTIVMRRGAMIAGRITKDGEPLAGAKVSALYQEQGDRTVWVGEDDEYEWKHGALRASRSSATSGADGRYTIEGLSEAEHSVQVETAGPDVRCTGFRRIAEAPDTGVDFEVATARVVVLVRSNGAPVADVDLWGLSEAYTSNIRSDAAGRAEVHVAPGSRIQIQSNREGFRELVRQFRAPAAGAEEVVTLELEPLPPRGTLVVKVLDPEGNPIEDSTLALFRAGDTGFRPKKYTLVTDWKDGRIELSDAEPGRYRLVVRGARSFDPNFSWDGDAGTWIDVTQDVEVPAAGEKEITVTPRRGGRLRIAARNAQGEIVGAHCEIRGPDGALVESLLVARHGTRGAHSSYQGYLDREDVTEVETALAPGSYRIKVRAEGSTVERTADVVVVEGKTVTAEFAIDGASGPRSRLVSVPAQDD